MIVSLNLLEGGMITDRKLARAIGAGAAVSIKRSALAGGLHSHAVEQAPLVPALLHWLTGIELELELDPHLARKRFVNINILVERRRCWRISRLRHLPGRSVGGARSIRGGLATFVDVRLEGVQYRLWAEMDVKGTGLVKV
uniref:Uncharacterized protein n=1 Tax=Kwoniella dejecticola CBS 10117 TaxID=1296121 RepID=A0A1A6AAA0_9TREE|nr:uncharacterized protein I303_03005 [Kwoniella dejecticola CBS 10117]OBR86983.1 hypothetical protein I303_03005 [Kwoniella dejecticola CBS 10117]